MYHSGTSVLHKFQLRRISLELVQQLKTFVFNYGYFILIHNEICHKYLTLLSLSFPLLLNSYEASWSSFSYCLLFLISVYSFHWLQCIHLGKELHTGEEKNKTKQSFLVCRTTWLVRIWGTDIIFVSLFWMPSFDVEICPHFYLSLWHLFFTPKDKIPCYNSRGFDRKY